MINKELQKRILSSIILLPLALFFIVKGSFLFNFFISICFFITCYEWHMMTRNKKYNVFGFIFLIFSFYSIYKIRNMFGVTSRTSDEYLWLLLITIVCVATDIGDSSLVVNKTGIIVPPCDVNALEKGIESLLTMSSEDRVSLGRSALKRIEINYRLSKIVEEYTSLYNDLAKIS